MHEPIDDTEIIPILPHIVASPAIRDVEKKRPIAAPKDKFDLHEAKGSTIADLRRAIIQMRPNIGLTRICLLVADRCHVTPTSILQ